MLSVKGLRVRYGDHVAVDDVDLEAADGEVLCVLGPSGCGKSSLLRAIAGLEPPTAGSIAIDGDDVTAERPDRRGVGFAFQDHALFPHRTVAENVAFGLRMQRLDRRRVADRVDEVLALVDLSGFGDRAVTELSGGEQQRVALARAIAPRPRLVMLDEPLGALDRELRDRLLDELPRVFAEIRTTVVYVTHDHEEALSLADRVAVMRDGRFVQVDAPDVVWRRPRTVFVARFIGIEPIVEAEVRGGTADTPLGALPLPGAPDGSVRLAVLPGAAQPAAHAPRDWPRVETVVASRRFAGDRMRVVARTTSGVPLSVTSPHDDLPEVGEPLTLAIDPSALHPLADH